MKTSDKVICVNAATVDIGNISDYPTSPPNGWVQLGQTYAVSDIARGGGLVLVGLPAIWSYDNSDVGWHPSRFMLLSEFQAVQAAARRQPSPQTHPA